MVRGAASAVSTDVVTEVPTRGTSAMPSAVQMVSVAFSPVVAMARHSGSCLSSKRMSVGTTTSRYLSEALSCSRRMAVAVSK